MPDTRKNLPICADGNGDHLNITVEELQELWGDYITQNDDRKEGEFTKLEAATLWEIPTDSAYDRLEKMVVKGLLSKRAGRKSGKKVTFYRKI